LASVLAYPGLCGSRSGKRMFSTGPHRRGSSSAKMVPLKNRKNKNSFMNQSFKKIRR
jgi:hypothetical protein